MATVVKSLAIEGIDGFEVEIEAMTIKGQQQCLSIIGLGDQAIKESGERIQAAMEYLGYEMPKDKTIVSLAPGDKRKRGSHYDLGIAIAVLQQTGQIYAKNLEKYAFIGELSLNGRIRPCNGVLSMVTEARNKKIESVILPIANLKEAKTINGIEVLGFENLKDIVRFLEGREYKEAVSPEEKELVENQKDKNQLDYADVKGQDELIEAIVLAVAGGHNILMLGEPGCGKTMIAQRIPTIMPKMTEKEALEVTKIHSISNTSDGLTGIIYNRPFRAPHHNVSLNALIGGGSYANPGEVSLAHNGVLFLDELAEFSKSTLDALRQPMEDKVVTISRVNGTNTYPANFMFVSAMNPCPCGYYPSSKCRCTDYEIIHYRGKISGPILERIDIQKNVKHVDYFDLSNQKPGPSSEMLRKKVEKARAIQSKRFVNDEGVFCNAQMSTSMIQKYCSLDEECKSILKDNCEKNGYSARVIHKLLRMARTSADLNESENIRKEDIAFVLNCRDLDKSNNAMYVIAS